MSLSLLVAGRRACFRRPEFKHDLVTYDVITPPAARIILDRLYRPAGLHWSLDCIEILNPIKRGWEAPAPDDHGERRILALHDVAYRLSATLWNSAGRDCSSEHDQEFSHRISLAATRQPVHLGLREFTARIAPAPPRSFGGWTDRPVDLGWMPFDTGRGRGADAHFFHAVAVAGTIDLTSIGQDSLAV